MCWARPQRTSTQPNPSQRFLKLARVGQLASRRGLEKTQPQSGTTPLLNCGIKGTVELVSKRSGEGLSCHNIHHWFPRRWERAWVPS